MNNEQQTSSIYIVLPIIIFLFLIGILFYFSPYFRLIAYFLYIILKICISSLIFDFEHIHLLIKLLSILINTPINLIGYDGFSIINQYSPPPFKIGIGASLWLLGLWNLLYFFTSYREKNITEKAVVEAFKAKSLDEIIEEWKLDKNLIQENNPLELAKLFYKARLEKNIPPNVIARKFKDRQKRLAITYFQRILHDGKIMVQITDPEKIKELFVKEFESLQKNKKINE